MGVICSSCKAWKYFKEVPKTSCAKNRNIRCMFAFLGPGRFIQIKILCQLVSTLQNNQRISSSSKQICKSRRHLRMKSWIVGKYIGLAAVCQELCWLKDSFTFIICSNFYIVGNWVELQDEHQQNAVDMLMAEVDVYEMFYYKHCKGRKVQLALCEGISLHVLLFISQNNTNEMFWIFLAHDAFSGLPLLRSTHSHMLDFLLKSEGFVLLKKFTCGGYRAAGTDGWR